MYIFSIATSFRGEKNRQKRATTDGLKYGYFYQYSGFILSRTRRIIPTYLLQLGTNQNVLRRVITWLRMKIRQEIGRARVRVGNQNDDSKAILA